MYHRILVAIDGSPTSGACVSTATMSIEKV